MSTRKLAQASPTAQGMKTENASISASKSLVEKAEMGANVSSNGNNTQIANANEAKSSTEQLQKHNQETKSSFQQRVTRNSPLLLASPGCSSSITIKKEPIDPTDHQTNSESEEGSVNSLVTKKQIIRGRKSLKEHKESKEHSEKEEKQEEPEEKDKDKESKEEQNDQKDLKDIKEKESTATTTNRLTRKSLANQEIANTRITRQRQTSGAAVRSETPPARGRSGRGLGRGKMPVPMIDVTAVTKRKRSIDVDNASANSRKASTDEPGPKYIKVEVKDPEIDNDELLQSSQNTNTSSECNEETLIKIKQEILDESESELPPNTETGAATSVSNTYTFINSTNTNTNNKGKGRWGSRKSTATTLSNSATASNNSPSTRATRQTRQSSPVQISNSGIETNKKRRMGSQTRSLLKTSVNNNAKSQSINGQEDDDSKDSMASSTNTDDIVLALIKSEKISMELDDDNTNDAKDFPGVANEKHEESAKITDIAIEESKDLPPPLVVDTDETQNLAENINRETAKPLAALTPVEASCSSVTSGSEKAASLSPSELVSEGVSEISVKQFYKKPKFLENNLGIEEDPKLGNLVQKVSDIQNVPTSTATTAAPTITTDAVTSNVENQPTKLSSETRLLEDSYSNESIKEGALRFEESNDDKKSNGTTQDESNSSGGDDLAPLLVVEDDDDEDLEDVLEVKDDEEEENEIPKEGIPQRDDSQNKIINEDFTDISDKVIPKLNIIDVDDEDPDQEDDLTLEESETISMDNNASINDDVVAEVEDTLNDDNLTELDNLANAREVIEKPILQTETELDNTTCEILEPNENISSIIMPITAQIESHNISDINAENEDNDVLAKIDAELKKIDERNREKLSSNKDSILVSKKECTVRKSIEEPTVANDVMEVVDDEKLILEDTKNISKVENTCINYKALDIKVDEGQNSKINNDIKLLIDAKEKTDKTDESHSDNSATDNKTIVDKIILQTANDIGSDAVILTTENSAMKTALALIKDDDATSMKSGQSTTSWVTLDLERDINDEDILKKKEMHLQNLGLVTHKAAEKRRLEVIQSSAANVEASKAVTQHHNKRNGKNSSHAASTHHEYTGTLKTIIKINRNSTGGVSTSGSNGRKTQNIAVGSSTSKEQHQQQQQQQRRQSLKMTFQKGRARAHGTGNNDRSQQDREGHAEDNYYTIQNETEEPHDHATGVSTKKDEKEEILIPEKASSFKFHPERLCEDQCFYCSGKFGLYDTPCHVGQIKSLERQQKILANEEKLTVDNCLCDACFRHVDRRANVPSYKKRLSAPGNLESLKLTENQQFDDNTHNTEVDGVEANTTRKCLVPECTNPAAHSLRRKCIRKSVKKFLLKFEIPTGAASVWLCQTHYDTVIQCSGCVLCKRRLGKNHMYHITSDTDRLEKALCEMGIPVQLGIGTAVCKLCRYFANLLMKPPDSSKSQKAEFVKNYRKRLLQFHNIHDGSNDASEADEDDSNSASNNDNNEIKESTPYNNSSLEQDTETPLNQKDTSSPLNKVDTVSDLAANNNEKIVDKTISTASTVVEHDFETTGISSDSSNSSNSNTELNSPKEMSKLKAILQSTASAEKKPSADISNVLRANPNISMRELFPGEEDLGLQFKAPFGSSSSQRTPEGWTRVQTFLQYDEPTRRLWEELQKPYGNQSSFLRHLILLEKYFRNGDLVLSQSASNNASVYTQTVRQRLTSYDKGHCGGLYMGTGTPKENTNTVKTHKEVESIPTFVINEDEDDLDDPDVDMAEEEKLSKSLSSVQKVNNTSGQSKSQLQRSRSLSVDKLTKQLSSNAVTITARPKDSSTITNNKQKVGSSPQKSLLKDNLLASTSNTTSSSNSANLAAANAATSVALAASNATCSTGGSSNNSRSILKCNLLGINKSVEILPISSNTTATITKSSSNFTVPAPPPPPPVPAPPVPETKQQKIIDVANKLLGNHIEAANQNKNQQTSILSSPPELVSLQRRSAGQATVGNATNNSSSNQQSNNLNKRPQLLVKPGTSSRPPPNVVILPDTLTPQERLQSKTWRPTLMPVEENQNLLNKNGPLYQTADGRRLPALVQVQSGGKPFLISIFDYNRMCILRREKLMRDQMLKATNKKRQEAKQQQAQQQQLQQQQQQQQNIQHQQQQQQLQKNLQNVNKNYQTSTAANQRQQQHQVAQQQLLQLQLLQHQQALFKAAAAANNSSNSQNTARYQPIAPKPATSNITTMPPLQTTTINANANFTAPMMPLLANAITNATNTGNVNPASSSLNNTSWLWNNFPDANQLLPNGGGPPGGSNIPKLPTLLNKPNNTTATLTSASNTIKQQQQQQQQQQFLLTKIPKSLTVIPQHKLMNNATQAASGNNGNLMKE